MMTPPPQPTFNELKTSHSLIDNTVQSLRSTPNEEFAQGMGCARTLHIWLEVFKDAAAQIVISERTRGARRASIFAGA